MRTRRCGVASLLALALACQSPLAGGGASLDPAPRPGHAVGVVFHDRDADGRRDPHEPGLPGVGVSNGRDVVRTDANGHWALPLRETTSADGTTSPEVIFFAIKPTGWAAVQDARGRSLHYRIHKPLGSPAHLIYPGSAATGPLPASIDFPFQPRAEPAHFRVAVVSDPQPYSQSQIDWFTRDVIEEVVDSGFAFGVLLGDLVGDDLALFEPLDRALSLAPFPWYRVLGNHDMNYDAKVEQHSEETFEARYGPATYAFEFAGAHFIVVDNVRFLGSERASDKPMIYEGGLDADTLRFIENDLAGVPRERLVVLMMHIPLLGTGIHQVAEDERLALLSLLADRPHTLSLSGHTHILSQDYLPMPAGAVAPFHHHFNAGAASGSWWRGSPDLRGIPNATMRCGAPNGYAELEIDGSRYALRFKAAAQPAELQMGIGAPPALKASETPHTAITVNVFAGSERTTVEMRVRNALRASDWTALSPLVAPDPLYEQLLAQERALVGTPALFRPLPAAVDSPHLWQGWLPDELAPGSYMIEIRSQDPFTGAHRAQRAIRIE